MIIFYGKSTIVNSPMDPMNGNFVITSDSRSSNKNRLRCENTRVTDILGMTSWRREVSSFVARIFSLGWWFLLVMLLSLMEDDQLGWWSFATNCLLVMIETFSKDLKQLCLLINNLLLVNFQGGHLWQHLSPYPRYHEIWDLTVHMFNSLTLTVPPLKIGLLPQREITLTPTIGIFIKRISLLVFGRANLAEWHLLKVDDVLANTGYSLNHPSKVKDNIYTAIDLIGLCPLLQLWFHVRPMQVLVPFYHFSGALAVKLPAVGFRSVVGSFMKMPFCLVFLG